MLIMISTAGHSRKGSSIVPIETSHFPTARDKLNNAFSVFSLYFTFKSNRVSLSIYTSHRKTTSSWLDGNGHARWFSSSACVLHSVGPIIVLAAP